MSPPTPEFTLGSVSMYVDILSSALDQWVSDLSGPELIEYALLCREELRAVSPPRGGSAYTALAAEIAYDRALIALCTERGIYAHATSFAYPSSERQRIESVLRRDGVDFDSPPKRRATTGLASSEDADWFTEAQGEAENQTEPSRIEKGASAPSTAACVDAAELSRKAGGKDGR